MILADIMRTAAVLSSPQIAVESDGSKVNLATLDTSNDSCSHKHS
jgi:hypothetical protein